MESLLRLAQTGSLRRRTLSLLHRRQMSRHSSTAPKKNLLLSIQSHASGFPSYQDLSAKQESIRHTFLEWKKTNGLGESRAAAPPPVVLAFTPSPVFTLGRRMHESDISPAERARLTAPLSPPSLPTSLSAPAPLTPQIIASTRGGLMTYHGPGQVVLWPILDLHSPLHAHFTVRNYARLLETTTQAALAAVCGIATVLDEDEPGVWIAPDARAGQRKIAAMGVHLRRHVTGLGVAVNLDVPVDGGLERNPWARFVPCGIADKAVTSAQSEMAERWRAEIVREFPRRWAQELARRLGMDGAQEEDV